MGKKKGGKLRNKASNASLSNQDPTSDNDDTVELDGPDSQADSSGPLSPPTNHTEHPVQPESETTSQPTQQTEPVGDDQPDPSSVGEEVAGSSAAAPSHEAASAPDVMAEPGPVPATTDNVIQSEAIHEASTNGDSHDEDVGSAQAALDAADEPSSSTGLDPAKAGQLTKHESAPVVEPSQTAAENEPIVAEPVVEPEHEPTPASTPAEPTPTSSEPPSANAHDDQPQARVASQPAPEPTHETNQKAELPAPHAVPVTNGHARTPSTASVSGTGIQDSRRSSVGSTGTISGLGSSSLVSGILIISALETIGASKEAKKSAALKSAADTALAALARPGQVEPKVVFEPLRLACETKSVQLMISALDCLGKLVSYDFFVEPAGAGVAGGPGQSGEEPDEEGDGAISGSLADQITSTVCDCFSPSSLSSSVTSASTAHDTLLLRLLSTLLSLIMSPTLAVHQSALLKAVRTVYNVFLLGRPGTVQTVAQATLGQIVGGVFGRVNVAEARQALSGSGESVPLSTSNSRIDLATVAEEDDATEPPTPKPLQNEGRMPVPGEVLVLDEVTVEAAADATAMAAGVEPVPAHSLAPVNSVDALGMASTESILLPTGPSTGGSGEAVTVNDLYIKDAFLVFRALCKLSMKPLGADSERDLKSHAMRSKLLSLHLVLSILQNHLPMFVDPAIVIVSSTSRERTPFLHAVKQYLCLALSRNAVSPVIQVFELSCEVFWRVLQGMRQRLKKEIEVLLTEIFLPILEMRNSTVKQKSLLLAVFARLAQDPQALVDVYLNYDCDRASLENIYERLLNIVSKLGTTQFAVSTEKPGTNTLSALATSPFPNSGPTLAEESNYNDLSATPEAHLKRQSLECLVVVLRSLVSWAARGSGAAGPTNLPTEGGSVAHSRRSSEDGPRGSETDLHGILSSSTGPAHDRSGTNTPDVIPSDDPSRFESVKQRKTTLLAGIQKFNYSPKKGIQFLIDTGFIRTAEPKDIARFLLNADGLDKAQIGEYLGEGEAHNISTMHAFVEFMDFSSSKFVDALRQFLQSFRLPGEAQKIDRYMLKFAERYTAGNAGTFANADTAYILAFSVILLNTDAHNPQVKKPMSKDEFIRNNRGIDDGKDLDKDMLESIYDEINNNEIRMKDEVEASGPQTAAGGGIANALATVGRDLQREAYVWQSEGMANKTEALFRTLVRGQRRVPAASDDFYSGTHFEHVRPMFESAWIPILAGISAPLQDSDDIELIRLSLVGFKQAIKIVCLFDLELERNAFVTTLAKFTFLNNLGEMKAKNVEAIKTLLDVAMVDGNYLKGSWREVLTCVSQLERFRLIAQGVDSHAVPELGRRASASTNGRRGSLLRSSRPTAEVAHETASQHITITADMIFSSTPQLSGTAIVDFVKALSEVSWEEIQASGLAEQPRVFCLQKLVEISYYNMGRIRLEWSAIWNILGEHFNLVTCHTNAKVSFLALDSLRQLAMRFLEKEELANFKFQKDFLKPFEYAMIHNNHPDARDMVLSCLHQMIQARVQNLRSGWRTMFGVFSAAAKIANERIAVQAFEIVQRVNQEHFDRIVEYGSFADLTVCITDFAKLSKYQRVSLQAIEMLKAVIPMMLSCEQCPLSKQAIVVEGAAPADDPMIKFWFPVLFGFYDVIMNGDDLEVRKRSLDYLFETLKAHGHTFTPDFWDLACKEVLFPIFAVLRSRSDVSRFSTHEDMSVWLSTTMIQALRNLVDLFTFYFDVLGRMLDRLLDLLCECICQENDTLARIGTSCLQQLLENNVQKLSPERWERIVSTFVHLFKTTTAFQLFDENLLLPQAEEAPAEPAPVNGFVAPTPLSPAPPQTGDKGAEVDPTAVKTAQGASGLVVVDRRRVFRQIIVKCVLQLLLIETTHELLQNSGVYTTIPPDQLLRLMGSLDDSYRFARKFNADKDLRMALWKVGFMRDLPNLLRQESTSAATLVNVLLRMHNDTQPEHVQKRKEVVDVFAPLGLDVLSNYVSLNPETQARNIAAWTPVVTEILQGFCSLEDDAFLQSLPKLYPLVVDSLTRDVDVGVRESLRSVFVRVGKTALKL